MAIVTAKSTAPSDLSALAGLANTVQSATIHFESAFDQVMNGLASANFYVAAASDTGLTLNLYSPSGTMNIGGSGFVAFYNYGTPASLTSLSYTGYDLSFDPFSFRTSGSATLLSNGAISGNFNQMVVSDATTTIAYRGTLPFSDTAPATYTSITYSVKSVDQSVSKLVLGGNLHDDAAGNITGNVQSLAFSVDPDGSGAAPAQSIVSIAGVNVAFEDVMAVTDPAAFVAMLLGGDDTITGTTTVDQLYGFDGNDRIDGKAGADVLVGGLGDDTYVVDSAADVVTEGSGEGTDTVQLGYSNAAAAPVLIDLGTKYANVENLTLLGTGKIDVTGTGADNILIGNGLVNVLTGAGGNDTLDGKAGADWLIGGQGNDTYIVDSKLDVVTEAAGQGNDTVRIAYANAATTAITVSVSSYANVENLEVTGGGLFNLTGDGSANQLKGNGSANVLDGGAGADTLIGGAGNDTYIIDDAGDTVSETLAGAAGGVDLIKSGVDYTLGVNLENLTLTGAAINGTGNELVNVLTGNTQDNILSGLAGNDTLRDADGNDRLDGGSGADNMAGGIGDDIYVVDVAGDVVTEALNAGTDTVEASLNYTLGANLENLVLTGTANLNGTGNALANTLTGNSGNNLLNGGAGADVLVGGLGDDFLFGGIGVDQLTGGVGADTFVFNTAPAATNIDTITDFVSATDRLQFDNAIFTKLGANGPLSAATFQNGVGHEAATAAVHLMYDTSTGGLYYDADGSGAGSAVQVAILQGAPTLTHTDITVV